MSQKATFLGPVDELPPEGADLEPSTESEVDFCASMFAESNITFDVSRDGVMVTSNPQKSDLFQEFEIDLEAGEEKPYLLWKDEAFDIHLQGLFRDRGAFSTLSDASDPEDYVRRFLEVLASSLDEPSMELEGKKVPLIRWQAGEDGESAEIQLFGLFLADDEQFEAFCKEREGEIGFIREDAEVQAHGIRETLTVMVILGVTLGSTTNADAGPFNFKKKKQAKEMARQQAIMKQQAIQRRQAAIQQAQRTGYLDMHNDAYVNHQLLESGKDGEKKVIVDISRQRAFLVINNQIAIDTAVSTAREGKHTPRGAFKITERIAQGKKSTIYGCDMPYWQRLDSSAIGMHVGDLPGHAASAGCIRLPYSIAPVMFANTASGVTVEIVDHWNGQELQKQDGAQQNYASQPAYQRGGQS
ncbi:L,D-transpeptidase family protein [Verrucomicrobiales bacterium]|nr:L,D-transpeptidase family protein [Verrucomicrobiales bacterium]